MRRDSRVPVHYGVGFIFAPAPELSPTRFLDFQTRLAGPAHNLVFEQAVRQPNNVGLTLVRQSPPLQVAVTLVGPGVIQLVVITTPQRTLRDFVGEAEEVLEAYAETWSPPAQIVRRDCTVRSLYQVEEEHAFRYLWERRLHQPNEAMRALRRPILGGGLRLVLPPTPEPGSEMMFEVKIESYLQDPRQLFVETQGVWNAPLPPGTTPLPGEILQAVDDYERGPVLDFIAGDLE